MALRSISVNIPYGDPVPATNPQNSGLTQFELCRATFSLKRLYTFSSPSPFCGNGVCIALIEFSDSGVKGWFLIF